MKDIEEPILKSLHKLLADYRFEIQPPWSEFINFDEYCLLAKIFEINILSEFKSEMGLNEEHFNRSLFCFLCITVIMAVEKNSGRVLVSDARSITSIKRGISQPLILGKTQIFESLFPSIKFLISIVYFQSVFLFETFCM